MKAQALTHGALKSAELASEVPPYRLMLRYRPCVCDESLNYEAYLYGVWQKIQIIADEELIIVLDEARRKQEEVEVLGSLSKKTYLSNSGQNFASLQVTEVLNNR